MLSLSGGMQQPVVESNDCKYIFSSAEIKLPFEVMLLLLSFIKLKCINTFD